MKTIQNSNKFSKLLKFSKVLLLLIPLTAHTQTRNEAGKPLITNFTPQEYGAHPNNESVVQDARGVMYFGNGRGVLEYDGASWRTIPTPNQAWVELAIDNKGRIYAAEQGEFGYLAADSIGQMHYVSLVDQVKSEDREFIGGTPVFVSGQGVYFGTRNRLFRWSNNHMRVWKPSTRLGGGRRQGFAVADRFYIRQPEVGLLKMVGDSLQMVPGGERFANEGVSVMLPFDEQRILTGTGDQGLFLYDGIDFQPFKTEVDAPCPGKWPHLRRHLKG